MIVHLHFAALRKRRTMKSFMMIFLLIMAVLPVVGQDFTVTRINNKQPIITQSLFTAVGATEDGVNINGPSLIRIPDWIAPENRIDSSAVYYLYFAHHQGDYIRLAWAAEIEGPYHLYKVGPEFSSGNRGVLDFGPDDKIDAGNSITIRSHLASPDVHVDDSNKQIIMYFHGPVLDNGQRNFVSTSPDGLSFLENIRPVILGGSYFKVFEYKDGLYSIDNRAEIYKALSKDDPWTAPQGFDYTKQLWTEREDNPFQNYIDKDPANDGKNIQPRHVGVYVSADTLFVFYSRIADSPERIMMSTIRLDKGTFLEWDPSYPPQEILHTEELWEGSALPVLPSDGGSSKTPVHQLRDPDVFEDKDGSLYLLYTGSGEYGIGLARLERKYGNVVHNPSLQSGPATPELFVQRDFNAESVLFKVKSEADTRYEIRVYGIDGSLVEILRGRCQSDGSGQSVWVPTDLKRGIYIASLISKNRLISVKFGY